MEKIKYTPGPWNMGTVLANETRYYQPISDARGKTLGVVYGNVDHRWTDEYRANARLIATAPDLLEALKEVMAGIEEREKRTGIIQLVPCVNRARAAIAKAERDKP